MSGEEPAKKKPRGDDLEDVQRDPSLWKTNLECTSNLSDQLSSRRATTAVTTTTNSPPTTTPAAASMPAVIGKNFIIY